MIGVTQKVVESVKWPDRTEMFLRREAYIFLQENENIRNDPGETGILQQSLCYLNHNLHILALHSIIELKCLLSLK